MTAAILGGAILASDRPARPFMAGRSAAREPVVRKRATSPRAIVRRFLRDLHVMHVALALAGTGDLHELRPRAHVLHRSEEHTSELQSLMRISYAVFCLK